MGCTGVHYHLHDAITLCDYKYGDRQFVLRDESRRQDYRTRSRHEWQC